MNVRQRLIPIAAVTALAALGTGTLSACSGGTATAAGTDTFDVVASFYPMTFLAEQIGGTHVHVTSLTAPGQEPHDLEISPRQIAALQDSDAVLYLSNVQPAVDTAVAQSPVKTKIDAASMTSLEDHGNEVGGHAAAHDTHHSEEAAGKDPHVWVDPVRYAQIAQGVGKAFEKADPQHAADYRKNTAALVKKLDDLDERFKSGLADTRTKVFITTHAAFGYLAERYGLTEEAVNGLDPESEPSAARVRDLEKMARADGVGTVFYETLVSDKTAKTIAHDAGLKTDVLDPIEGITKKSRGRDYFAVQEANLKALQRALGAK
ncbi:zinc ABC transporter substrate-binding protein [Streptomyces pluripotens]|uniref:Zinc ABC transporter substrate-binding protein n=1 Tax=Streptomyces pluripotens TaxID=1355015 RepID=A0A221NXZ9_9ACTN|nr:MULTISPECIES: metal ABC transporter substrate-binding protein [Streptomyces]ARP70127.1 zinc ABC transporter substrate-binding protein [Streptomyces pluripotens]ASN24385.1 zinc ABC transporter substrate-binding protein [Streptomyces pluripotens]KIE25209.1 ABC transporter substrate-binding protein [Streptomyces sp. MUSC 125]MCH0559114.1 zinc ABC transporter substrate-binding protein [Streptomyces sp. MUM 16J]